MSLCRDVFVSVMLVILFCNLVCVYIYIYIYIKICEEHFGGCMLLVSWLSRTVRLPGTDFAAEDTKDIILAIF